MNIESDKSTINIPLFVFGIFDIILGLIWLFYTNFSIHLNIIMRILISFLPGVVFIALGVLSITQKQKTKNIIKITCIVLISISIIIFLIQYSVLRRGLSLLATLYSIIGIYFFFHLLNLSENRKSAVIKGFAITNILISLILIIIDIETKFEPPILLKLLFLFFSILLMTTSILIFKKNIYLKIFSVVCNSLIIVSGFALFIYIWNGLINKTISGRAKIIHVMFIILSILIITYFSLHLISISRNKQYFVGEEN